LLSCARRRTYLMHGPCKYTSGDLLPPGGPDDNLWTEQTQQTPLEIPACVPELVFVVFWQIQMDS
jgi:hypothetical protein